MSVNLRPIGEKHFILEATTPVRIEVSVTEDNELIAHVYRYEDEPHEDLDPIGAFDSTISNKAWEG